MSKIEEIAAKIAELELALSQAIDARIEACTHPIVICEGEYSGKRFCPACGLVEITPDYHTFMFQKLRNAKLVRPLGCFEDEYPEHHKIVRITAEGRE